MQRSVIIIGAGLSGLIAGESLQRKGWDVKILEQSGRVGGRIKTDVVDGFLLDHGFQVFLTAYEQAAKTLDTAGLGLGMFTSGALVYYRGKLCRVADPWRSPEHIIATALSPIGSILDKLKIARFRHRVLKSTDDELISGPQMTALEKLRNEGFSNRIIDRFFRPFFGGIFLEPSLETTSGRMEFVFRTFSRGSAALPKDGMQAIPIQLADRLKPGTMQLNTTVAKIGFSELDKVCRQTVTLSDGSVMQSDIVIVATEQPAAAKLLDLPAPLTARATTCLYFAVKDPPIRESTLVLNGEPEGPINNLCFPSYAQPTYAPSGQHLLSVSIRGDYDLSPEQISNSTKAQLHRWFGNQVDGWEFLRTYRIQYALPSQKFADLSEAGFANKHSGFNIVRRGVYSCGDYCETASIEGAIRSGMSVAEAVNNS